MTVEPQGFCYLGHCRPAVHRNVGTAKVFYSAAATFCFGFLTIRMDDTTVLDFLKYAVRYFISTQQYYEWRAG